MITTYKFRIKDSNHSILLSKMAGQVNFVWNYCNEISRKRWKESRFYTNESDFSKLTKGSTTMDGGLCINAQTVQATYEELLKKQKQHKKQIRFRGYKRKLGWIPFKGQTIKYCNNYVIYNKVKFRFWSHRALPDGSVIKTGSFNQCSLGKWYLSLVIDIPDENYFLPPAPFGSEVGIDPGIKTILTLSDGKKFERSNLTNIYAEKLARAQRRRKKRQIKKIHQKIKNSRLDFSHKTSFFIAKNYENIYFGDAKPSTLKKTRAAKGVSDAAWHNLKTSIHYKALRHGGRLVSVSEKNTTVTCSACLFKAGPRGLSGLSIREWICNNCGSAHGRDHNAAKNILRIGRNTLISCG